MSYINATDVLPEELLGKIQEYIDGGYVYIPRKPVNRRAWGENTKSREETAWRNMEIFGKYTAGASVDVLSEIYFLSPKSIRKIIAGIKGK